MRRRVHVAVTEPRFELTPLLDVLFFLLMFFMYSMILSVRAQVLPVSLPAVTTGETPADLDIVGLTVDKQGQFFLNRKQVTLEELQSKLRDIAQKPKRPAIYLALEQDASGVDRGPIFVDLIDLLRRNGIDNFNIVGRKTDAPAAKSPAAPPPAP